MPGTPGAKTALRAFRPGMTEEESDVGFYRLTITVAPSLVRL
jgi:hypothetical protein